MNDGVTISTFQMFELFPTQEHARVYLESRLWPNGPQCPVCGLGERITVRKGGYYRCNQCQEDFTVRTGTIFERSHIPLHKWVYAMYLLVTARKGISSLQLAKEIGVTQKSAWFMLHRLREACAGNWRQLRGIIEVDETYVGGKERSDHPMHEMRRFWKFARHDVLLGLWRWRHRGAAMKPKTPKALDAIADVVLRYRPKPKSAPAKARRKKRRKLEKEHLTDCRRRYLGPSSSAAR